jgi:hypothetical protein
MRTTKEQAVIHHRHTVDATAHRRVSCPGVPSAARFVAGLPTGGEGSTDTERWHG